MNTQDDINNHIITLLTIMIVVLSILVFGLIYYAPSIINFMAGVKL